MHTIQWFGLAAVLGGLSWLGVICYLSMQPPPEPMNAVVVFTLNDKAIAKVVVAPDKAETSDASGTMQRVFLYSNRKDFDRVYFDPTRMIQHAVEVNQVQTALIVIADKQFYALKPWQVEVKNPDGFAKCKFDEEISVNAGELVEWLDGQIGNTEDVKVLLRVITKNSPLNGLVFTLPITAADRLKREYVQFRNIFQADYSNLGQTLKDWEDNENREKQEISKILSANPIK